MKADVSGVWLVAARETSREHKRAGCRSSTEAFRNRVHARPFACIIQCHADIAI
jgi:hypothetical protein